MRFTTFIALLIFSSGLSAEPDNCGHDIEILSNRVKLSAGPPRSDGQIQINISAPLKDYQYPNSLGSDLLGNEHALSKTIIAFTYGDGGCKININLPARV